MGVSEAIITAYGTIILNPKRSLSDELKDFMNSEWGVYFGMEESMSDNKRYSVFVYLESSVIYQDFGKCSIGDFEDELDRIDKEKPKISLAEEKAIEKLKELFVIQEPFFWMQNHFISY